VARTSSAHSYASSREKRDGIQEDGGDIIELIVINDRSFISSMDDTRHLQGAFYGCYESCRKAWTKVEEGLSGVGLQHLLERFSLHGVAALLEEFVLETVGSTLNQLRRILDAEAHHLLWAENRGNEGVGLAIGGLLALGAFLLSTPEPCAGHLSAAA